MDIIDGKMLLNGYGRIVQEDLCAEGTFVKN